MLEATQPGGSLPPLSDLEHHRRPPPERIHELRQDSSVLALAVNDDYIFAGTQNGELVIWSLATFQLTRRIQAHKRSVLSLLLSEATSKGTSSDERPPTVASPQASNTEPPPFQSRSLLISSAGDGIVSIWCPTTFVRLYEIYSTYDVGDVFSVAYSRQLQTIYIGAQNTTIQWARLTDTSRTVTRQSQHHPDRRRHRFFDSAQAGGTATPRRNDERWATIPTAETTIEIDRAAIHQFAHYGYVYCMLIAKGCTVEVDADEDVLVSGGGDGTIKLWRVAATSGSDGGSASDEWLGWDARELMALGEDDGESVLSLAIDSSFLYSGKLAGVVELWDLDTKQKLRVIKAHRDDTMSIQMRWGRLFTVSATGSAAKHSTVHYDSTSSAAVVETMSEKYKCLARWRAHTGKILASACVTYRGQRLFITGANDDSISIWRLDDNCGTSSGSNATSEDAMLSCLREFVSYKTVSSRPEYNEDCRKGASFLCAQFKRLGAHVEMLSTDDQHNPIVCAKFAHRQSASSKRSRILFYGHYDVVPAERTPKTRWLTDPFQLTGTNGYLYGRGVTDNKGPIMAALYAVSDLMQRKELQSDIVFLVEGEEESGSRGFQETVRKHKKLVGDIDYILLANSYWIDDETPCLTYGLRGVLHATVSVKSINPDMHSGVDGSYMLAEPLSDLTHVLSQLKGVKNRILIPDFYDAVLPLTTVEEARFEKIATILNRNSTPGTVPLTKENLIARWREPNLTIHRYKVSGPEGSLVSSYASANISLRLVPGQEVEKIIGDLNNFLREEFDELETPNKIHIKIDNKAEPWLGDPDSRIYQVLEDAVIKAWSLGDLPQTADDGLSRASSDVEAVTANIGNVAARRASSSTNGKKPLYIREGGSIPAIRFLEKEFGAPAAHLPCGQASDSAHLENERIRVLNLLKSREIFAEVFRKL